jgi:hypothetical protein
MWNFFKKSKKEPDNVIAFPTRTIPAVTANVTQEISVGEQELVDIILRELRKGGAIIIELADDDG